MVSGRIRLNGSQRHTWTSLGSVHQLVGKSTAPVIRNGGLEAGVVLVLDTVVDVVVVLGRVQDLEAALFRTLEDRVSKLPKRSRHVGIGAEDVLHRGEVVGEQRADQPSTSGETSEVGRGLQETTQVTSACGIGGALVEGGDGAGAVHQGAVASTGNGNTDVGQGRSIVAVGLEEGIDIEAFNVHARQEPAHGVDGVVAARLQP